MSRCIICRQFTGKPAQPDQPQTWLNEWGTIQLKISSTWVILILIISRHNVNHHVFDSIRYWECLSVIGSCSVLQTEYKLHIHWPSDTRHKTFPPILMAAMMLSLTSCILEPQYIECETYTRLLRNQLLFIGNFKHVDTIYNNIYFTQAKINHYKNKTITQIFIASHSPVEYSVENDSLCNKRDLQQH